MQKDKEVTGGRTLPLKRSRMTLALVKEVYWLKALDRTSSDTSLLRSPTNRRNQAGTPSIYKSG